MVLEVVKLDDRVVHGLCDLLVADRVWREVVIVLPVGFIRQGISTEERPQVNSILWWKIKSITDGLEPHWQLHIGVVATVLNAWIWDRLIELEAWGPYEEKLWVRWQVEVLSSELYVAVFPHHLVIECGQILQLGGTEHHDDDVWVGPQTLLIVASVPEVALDTVIVATEVQDLELLVWFFFFEKLVEGVGESFISPVRAIGQIRYLVETIISLSCNGALTRDHPVTNNNDSDRAWGLPTDLSMLIVALVESHNAGREEQRLSDCRKLHIY